METHRMMEWQRISDESEEHSLAKELPTEYPVGGHYMEEVSPELVRDWQRIQILSGRPGARWAYWAPWVTQNPHSGLPVPGIGPHPSHHVIADTIFNGDAPHFIGMLAAPYAGNAAAAGTAAWVMISPKTRPPAEPKQNEEKPRERYERSRDVYDVNTGQSRRLP